MSGRRTNVFSYDNSRDDAIGEYKNASGETIDHGRNEYIDINTKSKSVLLIYTGGTIGMSENEFGVLGPHKGYLTSLLPKLPELAHESVPSYDILEWSELKDSSDFAPSDWVHIANNIKEHYLNYDGFVVLCGTDTMAYTASALSFMLNNLAKPVIVTGAMVPLGRPISDAKRNLLLSMIIAGHLHVPEVCIFFNTSLLRGCCTNKNSNESIDAFVTPNLPLLGTAGVGIALNHDIMLPMPRHRFSVVTELFTNIVVVWLIPGLSIAHVDSMFRTAYETKQDVAIVLVTYGTGNVPAKNLQFIEILRRGIVDYKQTIVCTSQCTRGSLDMNSYETGHILVDSGVIDGKDMTVEACVTKLAYLMGKNLRGTMLKSSMETNLRGEFNRVQNKHYYEKDPLKFELPVAVDPVAPLRSNL